MKSLQEAWFEPVTWEMVRGAVRKVNPSLFAVIEALDPGKAFVCFKIRYPYGSKIVDKGMFYVPGSNGQLEDIAHAQIPKDIREKLLYCTVPLSLLLNKASEVYVEREMQILPVHYLRPGQLFGLVESLTTTGRYPLMPPTSHLSISAGARSVFMVPKISDTTCHNRIKRAFHLSAAPPQNLSSHWEIFAEIANHPMFDAEKWESEVLVFSDVWFKKRLKNGDWLRFKNYLLEQAWSEIQGLYDRHHFGYLWDLFSFIFSEDIRVKPHNMGTISHLISIAAGIRPGFQCNTGCELGLPAKIIQNTYVEFYGLNQYPAILMQPEKLGMPPKSPLYYSFNCPALQRYTTTEKPRRIFSEMREIIRVMKLIEERIKRDPEKAPGLLSRVKYNYFHSETDQYGEILLNDQLVYSDKNLRQLIQQTGKRFPLTASFFRGCIQISSRQ